MIKASSTSSALPSQPDHAHPTTAQRLFAAPSKVALVWALVSLLVVVSGAVIPAPAGAAVEVQPWRTGDPTFVPPAKTPPIVGVNYHGLWEDMTDSDRTVILDRMQAAGVEWVRLDIAWGMLQPKSADAYDLQWGVPRIDQRINEIHSRGMKTLLLVYWAPSWATGTTAKNGVPRNPQDFARATAWAADRWRGKVQAIELWNEPDHTDYLANTSVKTYTDLVKAAYPAIKAVNPAIKVVAGAPTYVKTDWFRSFYAYGGADHYDALGIHPYIGMSDTPPSTCDKNWMPYYPCNIANLVKLMADNGDADKTIWATEYGWSAHDNSTYGPDVDEWMRGVTLAQQAKFLIEMQEVLAQWPQVEASFWYTERNTARNDAMEDNYGLLNRDLSPKPVYYAMKCAAAGICGPAATTAPTAPVGVSAAALSASSVRLSWAATAGATSYRVFRNGTLVASGVTQPTFTDTGLSAETSYSYAVRAVNSLGVSPASTTVWATTLALAAVSASVPASQDTWASSESPSANEGSSWVMWSAGGPVQNISYMRFDLPAATGGRTLTSARLKLKTWTNNFSGSGDSFQVRIVPSSSWSETTLTWGNRPAVSETVVGAVPGGTTPGANITITLSAQQLASLAGGPVTLAIAGSSSDTVEFATSEAPSGRPTLDLVYE